MLLEPAPRIARGDFYSGTFLSILSHQCVKRATRLAFYVVGYLGDLK